MPISPAVTAASLTPQAVTSMLRAWGRYPDVTVDGVAVTPIGTGQMAASLRLELDHAADVSDAPTTLVAKIPSSDDASRRMAAVTGAYHREVRFYQHIADHIATRTPECYYAEISDDGLGFVVLLEDMGPATSVEQIGGCTAEQASLALAQAAALHGSSWQRDYLRQDWLPVESVWNMLGGAIGTVVGPWLDRFGDHLDTEQVAVVNRLTTEVGTWLETLREHRTLWHGDFRLDNLLFGAQGGWVPVAVVDWQSVAAAPGVIDVSYFLGTSLTVSDRETHERDLVAEYHQRLVSHGVQNYTFEECRREYRAHAIFGLVLTIPISMGVETTERGDAMFGAMARRVASQIVANESFEALRSR